MTPRKETEPTKECMEAEELAEFQRLAHEGQRLRDEWRSRAEAAEARLSNLSEELKLVSEQRDRMAEKLDGAEAKLAEMTKERDRWSQSFQAETLERDKVIREYENFRRQAALDIEAAYGAAAEAGHVARAQVAERFATLTAALGRAREALAFVESRFRERIKLYKSRPEWKVANAAIASLPPLPADAKGEKL